MFENWQSVARRLLKERGIKQEHVAKRFDVSLAAFNHWLNGRREPKFNTVIKLLHQLGLRSLEINENGDLQVDPRQFEEAIFTRSDGIRARNEINITPHEEKEGAQTYPIFATRTEIEQLPAVNPHHLQWLTGKANVRGSGFWLKINTEAMSSATGISVPDGAYVLFDTNVGEKDGVLALYHSPSSPTLLFRQLHVEVGTKYLRGLNPKWPTVPLPRGSKCLGVAVEMRLIFNYKQKR